MSHLIGVFGGSDEDERPPKEIKKKSPTQDQRDKKKPENQQTGNGIASNLQSVPNDSKGDNVYQNKAKQKAGMSAKEKSRSDNVVNNNLISVFADDEDDAPKKPKENKNSQKSKEEYKKGEYFQQNTTGISAGAISMFNDDDDDEHEKPIRPPPNKANKGPKPSQQNAGNTGISAGVISMFNDDDDDEHEKPIRPPPNKGQKQKPPGNKNESQQGGPDGGEHQHPRKPKKNNHQEKKPPEGIFPVKDKALLRKERREKRKNRRHNQNPYDNPDNENNEDEDDDHNGLGIASEKPTLIKLLNANTHGEKETTLEEFLEEEYNGYVVKPREEIQHLPKEKYYGNTEYKLKLVHTNPERIEQLATQMKFRLQEGNGEAKYRIGVEDNGTAMGLSHEEMLVSLKTLCLIASSLKADVALIQMGDGYEGKYAEIGVRSNQKDGIKLDIKIMLLGDKQSGKSTLIGVLTSGQLDNGTGSARMQVHVHKHEVLTGETSSLSHHIMGFDSQGNVTNHTDYGHPSWEQIVDMSTKILTFLDIGGHEKYTTKIMSSLCSFYPDYALIIISACQKVTPVTEQHLKLACIFEMPITIVITHVDLITEAETYNLKSEIERAIRKFSEDKYLVVAKNEEDNVILSRTLKEKLVIPVFMLSNVDGTNLDLFKSFLNLLPVNNPLSTNIHLHSEFYVHAIFHKTNQIILGGTVINGCINKNQVLFLGPDEKGNFRHVEVANIECKKVPVKSAYCGQSCTIEIKLGNFEQQWAGTNKETIRRGMVLVDNKSQPKAAFEFTAEISLLEEKVAKAIVWEGYEPVVTSQTTHQACTVDFEGVETEEATEEDLQKLRIGNGGKEEETIRKGSLTREPKESPLLLVPDRKHRSKSHDYKDEFIGPQGLTGREHLFADKSEGENNESLKDKNENLSETGVSDFEENKGSDVEEYRVRQTKSELVSPKLPHLPKEGEGTQKITFQEKIKRIKKTVFKDVEELVSKRRKRKFIGISTDEEKLLKFKFKYYPEYITKGQKIIINDSTMKAIGIIKDIIYIDPLE